jgi:predicted dehydrogenase
MNILQVGLGGFGKNHLRAWQQLGLTKSLYVADLSPERLKEARDQFNVPAGHLTTDYHKFLDQVDVVDVVTPSNHHAGCCFDALQAGRDVFVEKPMTMTRQEAELVESAVLVNDRILQVGYYYRFHPITAFVREHIRAGLLGTLRYLSGRFMGFKRARTDVGVTHTDGIHFIDLFNALVGEQPKEVYAVVRDHFGRGMEDLSIVLLQYPSGVTAKVESGYIQPGQWIDRVVPNAMTTKDITVVGSRRTIVADFEIDKTEVFEVQHQNQDGIWTPVHGPSVSPRLKSVSPVELVALELQAFLASVSERKQPEPDVRASGLHLATVMEAVYRSAETDKPVALDPFDASLPLHLEALTVSR